MSVSARTARAAAGGLAAVAWFGFGLQYALSMQTHYAHGLSAGHAHLIFFGFYTILTNLLVSVSLTTVAAFPDSAVGRFFAQPTVATAVASNIVLVGLGYHVLLRNIWDPQGLQLLADVLMHYVTPGLYVLFWAVTVSTFRLRWTDPLRWCVYPIAYYLWVLIRSAWIADYPYPFFDVTRLGHARSLLHAIGLLMVFVLIGLAFVAVGRWRTPRR